MRTADRGSARKVPHSRWRQIGRTLLTLSLLSVSFACAREIALIPKAGPEQVRLYEPDRDEFPEPGYIHLGPVTVTMPDGTPRDELLLALRAAAAREGADAVVLQHVRTTEATIAENGDVPVSLLLAEGLAIFWP